MNTSETLEESYGPGANNFPKPQGAALVDLELIMGKYGIGVELWRKGHWYYSYLRNWKGGLDPISKRKNYERAFEDLRDYKYNVDHSDMATRQGMLEQARDMKKLSKQFAKGHNEQPIRRSM